MKKLNITLGEPVTVMPPKTPRRAEPSEETKAIIAACMGLREGEYLPVECEDRKTVALMAQRTHGAVLKSYGIKGAVRGMTVYFYRNGTH